MKKMLMLLAVCVLLAMPKIVHAATATTQVDSLIKLLTQKGIITETEGEQLKGQIAYDEKDIRGSNMKSDIPEWVQNLKLSGDLRLRDQYSRRDLRTSNIFVRNRGRVRARVNLEGKINDKIKGIIGIATDGNSGRSSNVTFGGNASQAGLTSGNTTLGSFDKPGIVLNKAYIEYTPNDKLTLLGGKMDNPLWEPGVLLWDPDITPEGGAIKLEKKLNDHITPFATNAFFVLKDQAPSTTTVTMPYIFASQAGIKGNVTEKVSYKAAGTWYGLVNPSHITFDNNSGTNGSAGSGFLSNNFNVFVGAMDVSVNDPFGELLPSPINIPKIGVFGQYALNMDPSHNNAGWQMGAYLGNSAINGWGTWKAQSSYRVLEREAWPDNLTDDDFYGGDVSTSGWVNKLDVGLAKNTWLSFACFNTRIYKTFPGPVALTEKAPETLVQADLNFKF